MCLHTLSKQNSWISVKVIPMPRGAPMYLVTFPDSKIWQPLGINQLGTESMPMGMIMDFQRCSFAPEACSLREITSSTSWISDWVLGCGHPNHPQNNLSHMYILSSTQTPFSLPSICSSLKNARRGCAVREKSIGTKGHPWQTTLLMDSKNLPLIWILIESLRISP